MKLTRQILLASTITLASVVAPRFASAAEHVIEIRHVDTSSERAVEVAKVVP